MALEIVKSEMANALTSADSNHVIAVTEDVYDESQNKYQSAINAQVIQDIENLKNNGGSGGGGENPNPSNLNIVDALPFEGIKKGVTLTIFSDLETIENLPIYLDTYYNRFYYYDIENNIGYIAAGSDVHEQSTLSKYQSLSNVIYENKLFKCKDELYIYTRSDELYKIGGVKTLSALFKDTTREIDRTLPSFSYSSQGNTINIADDAMLAKINNRQCYIVYIEKATLSTHPNYTTNCFAWRYIGPNGITTYYLPNRDNDDGSLAYDIYKYYVNSTALSPTILPNSVIKENALFIKKADNVSDNSVSYSDVYISQNGSLKHINDAFVNYSGNPNGFTLTKDKNMMGIYPHNIQSMNYIKQDAYEEGFEGDFFIGTREFYLGSTVGSDGFAILTTNVFKDPTGEGELLNYVESVYISKVIDSGSYTHRDGLIIHNDKIEFFKDPRNDFEYEPTTVTGIADPTTEYDAVNKKYVD